MSILLLIPLLYGQGQVEIKSGWKAVKQVIPDYPDRLKKEGVDGTILLDIVIDTKGNPKSVGVWKSLHPELDSLTVDAFKKWKFEPFLHKGEPMHVIFFVWVIFNAGNSSVINEGPSEAEPVSPELHLVLDKCADYCQKLSTSALYYVCQENIVETNKKLVLQESGATVWGGELEPNEAMVSKFKYPGLQSGEKSSCNYDYQLVRREGRVEERRVLLEENGRKAGKENFAKETCGLCLLKPILVPTWLLDRKQQALYSYKMAGEARVMGKRAYVILATRLQGAGGDIKTGKILVDKVTFQVLKTELEASSLAGYEQFSRECSRFHVKPRFTITHFYETEKNGILFPSRSEVRVEYTGMLWPDKGTRYEADVHYGKYRFFTVETESGVKDIRKLPPMLTAAAVKSLLTGRLVGH